MADTLQPGDAKDVEAAVQWMLAEGKAAEIVGHGSKRAIGRPAQTDVTLDLSALSGVMLYEPEELVLSAKAATPLAEIEALVASRGQQLAFEPMDYATILGGVAGRGTIGGALAANLSGPRRIKAGAARDHFLGFAAVSGRGETFKSGGRVVKNVTGYDLCKLIAGSWGTLAAMTEVTIKVLPAAETEETLLIRGLEPAQAIAAMTIAMGSACDVSGAAHLPARWRRRSRRSRVPAARDGFAARRFLALGRPPSPPARGPDEIPRRRRDDRARPRMRCGERCARYPVRRQRRWCRAAALAHLDGAKSRGGARLRRSRQLDAQVLYDWAGGSSGWRSTVLTMPARRLSAPPWPRPEDMPRLSGRRPRCAQRPTYSPRRRRG